MSTKAMVWQAIGSVWPSLIMDDLSLVDRIYPLSKTLSFQVRESGYLHIQASKPDTVGKYTVFIVGVNLLETKIL